MGLRLKFRHRKQKPPGNEISSFLGGDTALLLLDLSDPEALRFLRFAAGSGAVGQAPHVLALLPGMAAARSVWGALGLGSEKRLYRPATSTIQVKRSIKKWEHPCKGTQEFHAKGPKPRVLGWDGWCFINDFWAWWISSSWWFERYFFTFTADLNWRWSKLDLGIFFLKMGWNSTTN